MFNSIILDKSAFESLNIDEIFFLHRYYYPIVSHILINEILADLKKNDSRDEKKRVQQLAHKILQLKPKYSINYQLLIESELAGNKIEMSRRPIVGQGKYVKSEDGKRGYVFDQPLEEQILQRWQLKKFSEADKLSSESWRLSIERDSINIDELDKPEAFKPLKNLNDIVLYVEKYINLEEAQKSILENILSLYKININIASNVFYKFESKQFSHIKDFAPYTIFCYKIFLVFSIALARGIITPRKTDIIDLQYLYYIPFASIFSSNDKFHKMFAPLFLGNDQIFILGSDLKKDLSEIVKMRDSQNEVDKESWNLNHRDYPPYIKSSFTFNLWERYIPKPTRNISSSPEFKSPEENKKLIEMLNKYANSPTNKDGPGSFNDDGTDFIVIKSKVGPNDFCPCGSGKLFKDCHYDEVLKNQNT